MVWMTEKGWVVSYTGNSQVLSPSYTSQQVTGVRPKSQSLQTDRWISARVLRLFSLLDSSMVLQSRQEAWSRRSDFMAASVGLDRKLERVPREVCTPFTFSSYHPLCLLDVHRLVCLWVYGFFGNLWYLLFFLVLFCFFACPVYLSDFFHPSCDPFILFFKFCWVFS